ncbi:hypothetical protein [Burkholderia ubonensis]|uniref:hypothetical protein n=1 Tax=Burkholderia ubonensis TaxID=101571 RepID=UPI001E57F44E|nr:hypothetical protein [Burkholderia ubonensis]
MGGALARRPSVVILDEPTSSLDGAREARIFARLRQRVPTLVVMTHHHSLLKAAETGPIASRTARSANSFRCHKPDARQTQRTCNAAASSRDFISGLT